MEYKVHLAESKIADAELAFERGECVMKSVILHCCFNFLKKSLFDHASCKEKKVKQIVNATIDYVCLSVSQVGVIGEYFIPFIYYMEIESPIYLAQ